MSAELSSAVVVQIREQKIKKPRARPARDICRLDEKSYAHIPGPIVNAVKSLKHPAASVLLYAAASYRSPNKPIALPVQDLERSGYGSKSSVSRAIQSLYEAGLLIRVKAHGNGRAALYFLSWKRTARHANQGEASSHE